MNNTTLVVFFFSQAILVLGAVITYIIRVEQRMSRLEAKIDMLNEKISHLESTVG